MTIDNLSLALGEAQDIDSIIAVTSQAIAGRNSLFDNNLQVKELDQVLPILKIISDKNRSIMDLIDRRGK